MNTGDTREPAPSSSVNTQTWAERLGALGPTTKLNDLAEELLRRGDTETEEGEKFFGSISAEFLDPKQFCQFLMNLAWDAPSAMNFALTLAHEINDRHHEFDT
jgi:hypothetical protein